MRKEYMMLGGLFLMGILALFILFFEDDLNHNCIKSKEFKVESWVGIVNKKYRDSKNHNAETFEISKNRTHVMFRDGSEFYDFIVIGDSVIKNLNTDTIKVYRQGEVYNFKIYFSCNDQ